MIENHFTTFCIPSTFIIALLSSLPFPYAQVNSLMTKRVLVTNYNSTRKINS